MGNTDQNANKSKDRIKGDASVAGRDFSTIRDVPVIDRPREKLLERGPRALSNRELVVALLGTGFKGKDVFEVADEIVELAEKKFDSLSAEKLQSINGVGTAKACQIMAAIEFSRRFLIKEGITVRTDRDVLALCAELPEKKQEHFLTLTLDGDNNLIRKRTVFIGTLNQSLVHPREVFADALMDRAAAIILVHNHPSGNSAPSSADFQVTDRLLQTGIVVGIEVIDHIIVGKSDYYSFQKNGHLKSNKNKLLME